MSERIYKALILLHEGLYPRLGLGEIELPAYYAESLLSKAAGHKYIKRVPTGKAKPKYRYYYAAHAGNGVHAHEHMVAGASFRHKGGHWHIKSTDGEHLHVHHDESGETRVMTKHELAQSLKAEHEGALKQHEAKQEQERKDVAEHGSDAQRKRAGLPTRAEQKAAEDRAEEEKRKAEEDAKPKVDTSKIHEMTWGEKEDGSGRGPDEGHIFQDGKNGPYYVAVSRKEGKRLSRREMSDNEDMGHYGIRAYHTVHARRATPEEEARFKDYQARRDAHNKALEQAKYGTGGGFKEAAKTLRTGAISNGADRDLKPSATAEIVVNPANPRERFIIDKDAGLIHHDEYNPAMEGSYSYSAPYNETLAGWARDAAKSTPKGPFSEPRPTVDVSADIERLPASAKSKPEPKSSAKAPTPSSTSGRLSYDDVREKLATHPKVTLSGNTFDHKDTIKELGGRWDPDKKAWTVDTKRTRLGPRQTIEAIERLAAKRGMSATFHKALTPAQHQQRIDAARSRHHASIKQNLIDWGMHHEVAHKVADHISNTEGIDSCDRMKGRCDSHSHDLARALHGMEVKDEDGDTLFKVKAHQRQLFDPPDKLKSNELAHGHFVTHVDVDGDQFTIDPTAAQFPEMGHKGPAVSVGGHPKWHTFEPLTDHEDVHKAMIHKALMAIRASLRP